MNETTSQPADKVIFEHIAMTEPRNVDQEREQETVPNEHSKTKAAGRR